MAFNADNFIMNRCAICGKIRKWKDLFANSKPDSEFTAEDLFYECRYCIKKTKNY